MTKASLQFTVDVECNSNIEWFDHKDELIDILSDYFSLLNEELEKFMDKFNKNLSINIDGFEINRNSLTDKIGFVCVWFEGTDREKIKELLNTFKPFLKTVAYSNEITVYGDLLYGGYPSYDPPTYEEYECPVYCSVDWICNEIEFIEEE